LFTLCCCQMTSAEAGGVVTDAAGNPLDFSKGRYLDLDTGIIVTNQKLTPSLLKAVRESIEEKISSLWFFPDEWLPFPLLSWLASWIISTSWIFQCLPNVCWARNSCYLRIQIYYLMLSNYMNAMLLSWKNLGFQELTDEYLSAIFWPWQNDRSLELVHASHFSLWKHERLFPEFKQVHIDRSLQDRAPCRDGANKNSSIVSLEHYANGQLISISTPLRTMKSRAYMFFSCE